MFRGGIVKSEDGVVDGMSIYARMFAKISTPRGKPRVNTPYFVSCALQLHVA